MKYSVVIPLYNKKKHIERTIHSVLLQTQKDFEVVIIDDGSSDGSLDVVKKFNDKRICIYQQKNAGVSSARNSGIKKSSAEFIAFLDADDEWLPNHLQAYDDMIKEFPYAGLYATAYEIYISETKVVPLWSNQSFCQNGLINKIDYFKESYQSSLRPVHTSSVCIPKHILEIYKGFKDGCHHGEDLFLWGQIALDHSVIFNCDISARRYLVTENQSKATRPVKHYELPFVTYFYKNQKMIEENLDNSYVKEYAIAQQLTVVRRLLKVGNRAAALKILVGIQTKYQRKKLLQFYIACISPTFFLKKFSEVKRIVKEWL